MGKKFKRKKMEKTSKKGQFKKGTFVFKTDVSVVEQEEGVNNLVLTHVVENVDGVGGEVEATIVWKNMDEDTIEQFEVALEDAGIEESNQTFSKFNDVVKEWRKLTKALANINNAGERFAKNVLKENA